MAGNRKASGAGINECGVESLVIACIGIVMFIPAFFIAPIFFNGFAYAFCALAIALGIFALVEMGKAKNWHGLAVTITGMSVAIASPIILIVIRLLLALALF